MFDVFSVPQNITFGKSAITFIPEILKKEQCSSVFLISDNGLAKIGLVERVSVLLKENGIRVFSFTDISTNPTSEAVESCFKEWKLNESKVIIALGGGSPMDVAKAVGVLASYGGSIKDYEGSQKVPGEIVPIIAIPTTAGTGSEVTASSVITDSQTHFKYAVFSDVLKPKYAILDPDLISTLPKFVAAMTGVDAFIHAFESFISLKSNPVSESFSLGAIRLFARSLEIFVDDRTNSKAAEDMLLGSMLAGIAFTHVRLGNIHAMSHPLSGHFGVPHGVANASLLVTVLEYNAKECAGKYREVYEILSGTKPESFIPADLIEWVKNWLVRLGLPIQAEELKEIQKLETRIDDALLNVLVEDAMMSGNVAVNPRFTTADDIEAMYRKTLAL